MNKLSLFIFLLVVCSLKFFDSTFVNTGIIKNLSYGFILIAVIFSLPSFFKYSGGFVLPVQLLSISIFASIFTSWYTWDQDLSYSPTTIPCMIWFVFFLLLKLKIPVKDIENIVLIYGAIYVILFMFQISHSGTVYFGTTSEFKVDRGVVRVNFPGGGVFFLSCFIVLNRVTSEIKHNYLWLILSLLGVVIITLQVTRQAIVFMVLMYLMHFLRNLKFQYKVATILAFAVGVFFFITANNTISKGLVDQQKEDAAAGGDYIRILSAKYYLTQFTPNTVSKVFGNGFMNDKSNYGKALIRLNENYGYYLTDVGLVEVYITFGCLAILGFILLFIRSIRIPVPDHSYYLKYYLWFVMLTSITSDFLISYNFLIATVFVLYCYQLAYQEEKRLKLILTT